MRSFLKFRACFVASALAAMAGCGDAENARRDWLQNTLVDDNYAIILREPELSTGKFAKMESTLYNYFRGTAPQFWRDMSEPGGLRLATAFGTAESSAIWLVGDPHPENVGTFRPASGVTLDFNDFDAARLGPFHFDVWRLALGFDIAARTLGDGRVPADVRAELPGLVAGAYWDEVHTIHDGDAFEVSRGSGAGVIAEDLMRRAERDGRVAEELAEYTRVIDGVRSMYFGVVEPSQTPGVVGDETLPVTEREEELVEALLAEAALHQEEPSRANTLAVKGIARRVGAGVASYPLLRYYVLVEGPTSSADDDWLLEAKEIRDSAAVERLPIFPARQYRNNAERAVMGQRALQWSRVHDPLLSWAAEDGFAFRIRHRTKYQKGADLMRFDEKLAEGDWSVDDVRDYAQLLGRLLAQAHGGADVPGTQRFGAEIVVDALNSGPGRDAFVAEVEAFVGVYAPQVVSDYGVFQRLRDDEGPLLGARRGSNEIR